MFVTSFYLVRDKLCFSRTRWMSYGWYFSGRRNVKPNAKKLMKNITILKILWRWSWRNVKIKMDIKAEVLSKKVQDWWRFLKIDGEDFWRSMVKFVMESFEANILCENMMKMISNTKWININAKKNTSLTSSKG